MFVLSQSQIAQLLAGTAAGIMLLYFRKHCDEYSFLIKFWAMNPVR